MCDGKDYGVDTATQSRKIVKSKADLLIEAVERLCQRLDRFERKLDETLGKTDD